MTMTVLQDQKTAPTAAVVSIDARRALVTRFGGVVDPTFDTVDRAGQPEAAFLLRVVDALGDCDHVAVVGSDPFRLAFEREYVAISHRPERLHDHAAS